MLKPRHQELVIVKTRGFPINRYRCPCKPKVLTHTTVVMTIDLTSLDSKTIWRCPAGGALIINNPGYLITTSTLCDKISLGTIFSHLTRLNKRKFC